MRGMKPRGILLEDTAGGVKTGKAVLTADLRLLPVLDKMNDDNSQENEPTIPEDSPL